MASAAEEIFGDDSGSEVKAASESEDAAQDVLDAITDRDPTALDMALKRHYELCASEPKAEKTADEED